MAYTNIPTRTSSDLNAAADINALMGNTDYILDIINPVGSWYAQYPSAETNTKATAFPTAEEPAELFGGSWSQYYEDEGLFFKTEGDPLSQTDGENNNRTTGLQTDMFQGHRRLGGYKRVFDSADGVYGTVSNIGAVANQLARNTGTNECDQDYTSDPLDDDTNGTPRNGKETRPRNRLMKLWYRTA